MNIIDARPATVDSGLHARWPPPDRDAVCVERDRWAASTARPPNQVLEIIKKPEERVLICDLNN